MIETKTYWVAYTNSDLTEGRGYDIPLAICEIEATAIRMARGMYIQGSDGPVKEVKLLQYEGKWYTPTNAINVLKPTEKDLTTQKQINAKRTAYDKALAAGLSLEEIAALANRT